MQRKIENRIVRFFEKEKRKALLVTGARQIGKTYIIRKCIKDCFESAVEINLIENENAKKIFSEFKDSKDILLRLSAIVDIPLIKGKTVIFFDEVQECKELVTAIKFLVEEGSYQYVLSGSLLGVELKDIRSVPVGFMEIMEMYPLDFEEFLWANGVGEDVVAHMKVQYSKEESLDEGLHKKMLDLFKKYMLIGGLPDAVNAFIATNNIVEVRTIHDEIYELYKGDASQYDDENSLKIKRIYEMIPSNMENKKKRIVAQSIENKRGKTFSDYQDEFEYLISAGIALNVQAISTPVFPLIESTGKNLLKLYLNDVGILSGILYGNNIRAILDDQRSINLGSVYETVVASELVAHGYRLFYYDNRSKGEVDYLIDDYESLSAVPIEVKSGKDYTVHSALNTFVSNEDYHIQKAFVLSNEREVSTNGKITYLPIYYVMFFNNSSSNNTTL